MHLHLSDLLTDKCFFFFLIAYACSQIKAVIPGPWLTGISAITSAITEGHHKPPSLGTKWQGK